MGIRSPFHFEQNYIDKNEYFIALLVILQIMLIMLQIFLIILQSILIKLQLILIILPLKGVFYPFPVHRKGYLHLACCHGCWSLEAVWRTKTAMSTRQVRWPWCESGFWRDGRWRWKMAVSATNTGQLLRHGWWCLSAVVRCWRESRLDNILRHCQLSDWAVSLLNLASHFLKCRTFWLSSKPP